MGGGAAEIVGMAGAREAEDSKLIVELTKKKMLPKWLTGAVWRRLPNDLGIVNSRTGMGYSPGEEENWDREERDCNDGPGTHEELLGKSGRRAACDGKHKI